MEPIRKGWFFDAGRKEDKLFKIVVLGINLCGT
jgi:hypothetical protein